jgi:hypothetical protein
MLPYLIRQSDKGLGMGTVPVLPGVIAESSTALAKRLSAVIAFVALQVR